LRRHKQDVKKRPELLSQAVVLVPTPVTASAVRTDASP